MALEAFEASLLDALADAAGSGDGAAAWGGMGGAAGCDGVASLAAWAVEASAGAGAGAGVGVGGAVTAISVEVLEELGIDSLVDLLLLADAWREVFVSFTVSFAGLVRFSGTVVSGFDSAGAVVFAVSLAVPVVSVFASLIVAGEVEATVVSARFAWGFARLAVRAGLTTGSWPTRWSSTTAPPMATAVMTPNAMPKWFTFFSSWL